MLLEMPIFESRRFHVKHRYPADVAMGDQSAEVDADVRVAPTGESGGPVAPPRRSDGCVRPLTPRCSRGYTFSANRAYRCESMLRSAPWRQHKQGPMLGKHHIHPSARNGPYSRARFSGFEVEC